jgi:hypothetical protein
LLFRAWLDRDSGAIALDRNVFAVGGYFLFDRLRSCLGRGYQMLCRPTGKRGPEKNSANKGRQPYSAHRCPPKAKRIHVTSLEAI